MVETVPSSTRRAVPGDIMENEYVEIISGRRAGVFRGRVSAVSPSKKSVHVKNDANVHEEVQFRMSSVRRMVWPHGDPLCLPEARVVAAATGSPTDADWCWPVAPVFPLQTGSVILPIPTETLEEELASHRLECVLAQDPQISGQISSLCLALARLGFGPATPFQGILKREMLSAQLLVAAEICRPKATATQASPSPSC